MEQKPKIRTKKRSQLKSIWFRYKKNKLAIVGLVMLIIIILTAIFAGFLADYDKDAIEQNMNERLQGPSKEHIFGTDHYGRDLFARIIFGARMSLMVGLSTIIISLLVGAFIGSIAGYYGGVLENVLMRIMDVFLAIPQTLLAIAIVAALGAGLFNLVMAMSIATIPWFSRVVRSSILSIKGQEFIEAAKACGTNDFRIITRHILPNAIGPIIVQATLETGVAIMSVAGLSFVGLGIQAPTPEWGSMLSEGKDQMRYYPYLVIIPGIAIMLVVMALNLMGDGLRDALDPKLKN